MSKQKLSIDLPKKRVSIKTIQQTKYVYYVTEYYKNTNGHYTNKAVSIGKLDPEDPGKFFPNNNYYSYFKVTAPQTMYPSSFINAGNTAFLAMRLERLGVRSILEDVFPELYQQIMQAALYMMNRGNVMLYMDDFYSKNLNPYAETIGEKQLSALYEGISKDSRWNFFKQWKGQTVAADEYVAYDVTSISTHAKDIAFAEKGYNRDHELLPQVNVGLFFSQVKRLPVCYELYNGSITDEVYLSTMMQIAQAFDIQPFLYVMDKGFLNANNIAYLAEEKIPFLMAVPNHQKLYKAHLLGAQEGIRHMDHYIESAGVFGVKRSVTIDDEDYTLFCYYDSEKAKVEERSLFEQVKTREAALSKQLNRKKRKQHEPFFNVEVEHETIVNFSRNHTAIQDELLMAGMFGILSNQVDLSPADALAIYRRRNAIESHYDSMKNQLDFDRFHTHHQQSTEGKFFIGFIAQILQADLLRVMNPLSKKPVPTVKALLLELEKIQRVQYADGSRLMAPLTKKQKDILKLFDIDAEDFIANITG